MDGKTDTWYSLNSISQREVGELQFISTRKQSFLLKGPKAVLPVTWQGLSSRPSTSSQQAGNPNLRRGPPKPITCRSHCLSSSFEACHLPLPLPAKPQSSTLAWAEQWGRCSQRVWLYQPGRPFPLSTVTAGGSLGRGAKSRVHWDTEETLFFPTPELQK